MDDELQQRLADAAGPAPTGPDMGGIRRRADQLRLGRQRRRRGVLAGLAAITAGGVAALVAWWVPGAPHTSKLKVVASPTSVKPLPPGRWPTRLVPLGGPLRQIVMAGGSLYGVLSPRADTNPAQGSGLTVVRYDVNTGRLAKGPTLDGIDDMTVAAGSLWAVSASLPEAPAHLYRIDPASLSVEHIWTLTASSAFPGATTGTEVSAVPGGTVWVAAGKSLYGIDPATDRVVTERVFSGDITSLSSSPRARHVYLSLQSTTVSLTVVEVDPATAAPILERSFPDAVAGGTVTAAPGGAWLTYRTGMLGVGVRLDANTLHTSAPASGSDGSAYDRTMGISISISDQVAWITSATSLSCADPTTSTVRATTNMVLASPVAAGRTLYATTPTGLAILRPPQSCFG